MILGTTGREPTAATGSGGIRARISDLWRAPLTDLPVREELVRQFVPLRPEMRLLEIGPGNGFTTYRLARTVRDLSVLEISREGIERLRNFFDQEAAELAPRVRLCQDDLARPGLGEEMAGIFDVLLAIEVLEFVPDPAMALANMGQMLRPGGAAYLQFPNYERAEWPTCYRERHELEDDLRAAGFTRWGIYELRLSPGAEWFFHWMHEVPLHRYRAQQERRGQRPHAPLSYEQTWAFLHSRRLERIKVPLHLYWSFLLLLMRMGGDVYRRAACSEQIINRNLFVEAYRDSANAD